jgi:hypothetical protein
LLPETITVGLFPGCCWLQRGRRERVVLTDCESGPDGLLAALDMLLAQHVTAGRKTNLHVLVSDSLATSMLLPWQDKLGARGELESYSIACFERSGVQIDERWVMQTAFRHFRSAGLGYALPRHWMQQLQERCERSGVSLRTMLPLSAAVYWRQAMPRKAEQSIVLLAEAGRITALICKAGLVVALDTQPINDDADAAGKRLLLRLSATYRAISQVQYWSPMISGTSASPEFIAACMPNAVVSMLNSGAWS